MSNQMFHKVNICEMCGFLYSASAISMFTLEKETVYCPSCSSLGDRSVITQKYASKLAGIYTAFTVEKQKHLQAILFDANGISNPRLVLRFEDNYFNAPIYNFEGLEFICTRDEKSSIRPVELIHYFDRNVMNSMDEFEEAFSGAVEKLLLWVRSNNY